MASSSERTPGETSTGTSKRTACGSGTRARRFHLHRTEDASGVSGTGCVAEGVVFTNGWVALTWLSDLPSVAFFPSVESLEAIHGHGGKTRLVYRDRASPGG